MAVKRYTLVALFLILSAPNASAACTQKTCVDVFTDKNQLVITAQKGSAKPTKKAVPKVIIKAKPVAKAPVVKPPTPKPIIKKPVVKTVAKPIVKKVATASLGRWTCKLHAFGDQFL